MDADNEESWTFGHGSVRPGQGVVHVVGPFGVSPSVVILRPVGDLDALTTPELSSRLSAQLDQQTHVILDLSEVTFLSSSGLRVLLEGHHRARDRERALHITGAGRRPVTRPLEITGLDKILVLCEVPALTLAAQLLDRQPLTGQEDLHTAVRAQLSAADPTS